MKIYQKLLISYFTIAMLVVIVGVISIITKINISDDIIQLVESSVLEVEGATEMSFSLQTSQLNAQKLLSEKYRGFIEPDELKDAEMEAQEAILSIDAALLEFEKWLSASRRATIVGIQLATKIGDGNEFEDEQEELEILENIENIFKNYRKTILQFIVLTHSDIHQADEWLENKLELAYLEALAAVREYEDDSESELSGEGMEIEEAIAAATYITTATTILSLVAALLLGVFISRIISKPLALLTKAAIDIGAGKLETRVNIQSNDEIGDLGRSFNKMTQDIQNVNQLLEHSANYNNNIIQSMQDTLLVLDPDGTIRTTNESSLILLGYEKHELQGRHIVTVVDREKEPNLFLGLGFSELMIKGFVKGIEVNYITKTGNSVPMLFSGSLMNGNNGKVQGIVCVAQDISQRKEVENKLIAAQHNAETANRAKSVFLSRMSHELRTPLNAIIGFSQLQEMQYPDVDKGLLEYAKEINIAGQHLLNLVNDILDTVQIEQDKLSINLRSYELNKIVEPCIRLVQQQADELHIKIVSELPPSLYLITDKIRLKQVLINLLTNAIKYNVKGGLVTLSAQEIGQEFIEISIKDSGIGIATGEHKAIFEPFKRLKYAESNQIQGTGIGLTLTKSLIEEMQGDIRVVSEINEGSTFYVTQPKGIENITMSEQKKQSIFSMRHFSVLYIEDNTSSALLVKMIFKGLPSAKLKITSTAEEGIELAKGNLFNLIIIDINLPKMDGVTALKVLKGYTHLENTTMIALSADALPEQIKLAMDAGFDKYITKPIDTSQFTDLINSL